MSKLLDYLTSTIPDFRRARLPSLFSDFSSQRASNPDGFQANILAWENGLEAAAAAGVLPNTLFLQFGTDLEKDLQSPEYGCPQDLQLVEDEGVTRGRLVALNEFLNSDRALQANNSSSASLNIPSSIFAWIMWQAGLTSRMRRDPERCYVLRTNLEAASKSLHEDLSKPRRKIDRVVPMQEFRREITNTLCRQISDTDFSVILKHLQRDRSLIVYDQDVVKFLSTNQGNVQISKEDQQLCYLKSVIIDLREQSSRISRKIENCTSEAKMAISKGQKPLALRFLRNRKVQESMLAKRNENLDLLEDVLDKIEVAADQVEIVGAIQGGTEVLRKLNERTGGVDRVDDVVEGLRDEMARADEVSNIMAEGNGAYQDGEDSEIEEELQQLIVDDRPKEKVSADADTEMLLQSLNDLTIPDTPTNASKKLVTE